MPTPDLIPPTTGSSDDRRLRAIARSRAAVAMMEEKGISALVIGSLAKGKFGPDSDIDFLLTFCPRKYKYAIEAKVEDILGDLPFDVVYLEEIPADKWSGSGLELLMPTLSVDDVNQVNAELHDISVEAQRLSEYLKGIESPLPAVDTPEHWRHTHVCGSAVEKIYTGMEKIMSNLAKTLDNDPVGKDSESWHKALLLRMSNPYPGVRGRVISEDTLALLNNLRGFRHRERNSYSATLDLGIVIERARDAVAAVEQLKNEVKPFTSTTGP